MYWSRVVGSVIINKWRRMVWRVAIISLLLCVPLAASLLAGCRAPDKDMPTPEPIIPNEAKTTLELIIPNKATATLASTKTDEVVTFSDPNLKAAIIKHLGKSEEQIHKSELEGLTYIYAPLKSISDLSGLEYCINVIELSLLINQISDISPLSNLTSLTELNLSMNQIGDISPLSNLTSLTELNLSINQINDISPLYNLTSLTVVCLKLNPVSDISSLVSLTNLTELSLRGNCLSSVSVDVRIPELEERGVKVDWYVVDKSPACWYVRWGSTLAKQGLYGRAIEQYNKAIELDPQLVIAYFWRGLSFKETAEKVKAIADFEKVVTLSDNSKLIETAMYHIEELSKLL